MLYEPGGLVSQAASDGQPLIFVAINYRLGRMLMNSEKVDLVKVRALLIISCSFWLRDQ